jgi:hypothetical protein
MRDRRAILAFQASIERPTGRFEPPHPSFGGFWVEEKI